MVNPSEARVVNDRDLQDPTEVMAEKRSRPEAFIKKFSVPFSFVAKNFGFYMKLRK